MERRGLACGNTVMDLRASFPMERWPRERRGGDINATVRVSLRITLFLIVGQGQVLSGHPAEFPFETTLACFLVPSSGRGIISYLVSQVDDLDPSVAWFLEMETSHFGWHAALVARQIRSHGFDLLADVSVHFQALPLVEMVCALERFYLEEGPYGEVLPNAEEVDGLLLLSPEEELLVADGLEVPRDPATSAEIETLKTVQYSQDDNGTSQEACPICCEDFEPHMLLKMMPLCSHTFHDQCLLQWLERSRACPLCRTKIADDGGPDMQ